VWRANAAESNLREVMPEGEPPSIDEALNEIAAHDVVYLTRSILGGTVMEVFRGRLRQAASANWIFDASTGQNGFVAFDLGPTGRPSWALSYREDFSIISVDKVDGFPPPEPTIFTLTMEVPTDDFAE
jgi:hypothetical protein